MKKWLLLTSTFVFIFGCQTSKVRTQHKAEKGTEGSSSTPVPPLQPENTDVENNPSFPPAAPVPVVTGSGEKWALILGPGGALAFGSVGVLRQFQKQKIDPQVIVGVEWASPIAALYSLSGTTQAIDWQFSKLKDDNFPGSSSWFVDHEKLGVKNYSNWLNEAFQGKRVENSKVGFICPSFNTQKKITYIMNRGEVREVLQYCWPFPPTLQSNKGAVAAPMALQALTSYLHRQGIQKIVLVNVLANEDVVSVRDEDRDLLWAQIHEHYSGTSAKALGVDDVITLDFGNLKPTDFKQRKEIMDLGEQKSVDAVSKLIKKYRL